MSRKVSFKDGRKVKRISRKGVRKSNRRVIQKMIKGRMIGGADVSPVNIDNMMYFWKVNPKVLPKRGDVAKSKGKINKHYFKIDCDGLTDIKFLGIGEFHLAFEGLLGAIKRPVVIKVPLLKKMTKKMTKELFLETMEKVVNTELNKFILTKLLYTDENAMCLGINKALRFNKNPFSMNTQHDFPVYNAFDTSNPVTNIAYELFKNLGNKRKIIEDIKKLPDLLITDEKNSKQFIFKIPIPEEIECKIYIDRIPDTISLLMMDKYESTRKWKTFQKKRSKLSTYNDEENTLDMIIGNCETVSRIFPNPYINSTYDSLNTKSVLMNKNRFSCLKAYLKKYKLPFRATFPDNPTCLTDIDEDNVIKIKDGDRTSKKLENLSVYVLIDP